MVPRKGILTVFSGSLWAPIITANASNLWAPIIAANASNLTQQKSLIANGFDVIASNILDYWYLEKVCLTPSWLPVYQFCKGAIVRHGQICQTYAYFSRPTVLISLLYLFRQCACFSTVLISLSSLFQQVNSFSVCPKP